MQPKFWGVMVFLLTFAVAATPASGGEAYVATAPMGGDATYMAIKPDGTLSDQQDMMLDIPYSGAPKSFGNGIGDFNGDGELDYVMAIGNPFIDIYIFPKIGPGPKFGPAIWVNSIVDGVYPADIAVADFNGDGQLDFVVNFLYNVNCGIFLSKGDPELGNVNFEFDYTLLTNTTPFWTSGVDAADFNNDQVADFVVAPNGVEPFRVMLGRGDGTFDQVPKHGNPGGFNAGITAGDFVDDADGNVDLAITGPNTLTIYTGNGDGTFAPYTSYALPVNSSPIDNGDFNQDGHQDLVVADYDGAIAGVAVLLGDGTGSFDLANNPISTGGPEDARRSVTALPYLDNRAPVAILTPQIINVTVGETVAWDASESFDEDGTIVGYIWDYGEGVEPQPDQFDGNKTDGSGSNGISGEAQASHVYYDSDTYYLTLTVVDDKGATSTVQAQVNVQALPVSVYFAPSRLNLKSKGKWVTATIRVPAGYEARAIDANNLYLVVGDECIKASKVYPYRWHRKRHKKKYHRIRELKAKFDRQALIAALGNTTGIASLTVSGEISTGKANLEFASACNVKVYEKEKKNSLRNYLRKQILYFFSKGKTT
jgi:hypothetical protein